MLVLVLVAALAAQNPQDTTRTQQRDSSRLASRASRVDSTALPDSLKPDSLEPVLPVLGPPPGPQPALRRIVFDDDFLRFSGVMSLGELLARIPGVFLVRSGWFGHPEAVAYAGQGPGAIELYQDGFLLEPIGLDSAGFDLGRFDLGSMRRVEVEVLPTVLRVYLIREVSSPRRARTEASFGTGDASTNGYRLRYENRWAGGAGLGVGATFYSTGGNRTSPASVNQLSLSARGTWAPNPRVGVEYQLNSYSFDRDTLAGSAINFAGKPLPGASIHRSDMFVRAFAATRDDGLGLRFDALLGSTSYTDSALAKDTSVSQALLSASWREARWSAESWTRVRDGRVPIDAGARVALSPLTPLTLSGLFRRRVLLGTGGSTEFSGGGSFQPASFLELHGDLRWRRLDDSSLAIAPGSQDVLDWSWGAAINSSLFSVDAGVGSHDAIAPPPFAAFRTQIPGVIGAGARVTTVSWELRPRRWLTLSGWWRDPTSDSVPFEPRNHSVSRLTFRSAFLPKFRRGAFDMMVQIEIESWGRGFIGADSAGRLVRLPGATTWNYHFQFRLVGAVIYWTMRNALFQRYAIIPGFELPRSLQRFGIRWEFTN